MPPGLQKPAGPSAPPATHDLSPAHCRRCGAPVASEALECRKCGAPRPARSDFSGEGLDWRSRRQLFGSPLVHIAFGLDAEGKTRVAQGWIAIGQRATGVIAIGIIARGFIALGIVALGFGAIGVVAISLTAAIGVNAVAPWACGIVAAGFSAKGVAALQWRP